MTDPLGGNARSSNNKQGPGGFLSGTQFDLRDECCWKFNKMCRKSASECKFDHRCTYCAGWYHSAGNCREKPRKERNESFESKKGGKTLKHSPKHRD